MALTEVNSLGIKDLEVKTGDIAADAVTGAKIADDQIDSEHYVDASIDHQHLANDCVDADNIDDNAVGLAAMAGIARGKLIVGDSNGDPAYLNAGSNDNVLTMDGNGDVGWEAPAAGGATINNATANELVTVASTTTQLDAEANLTFDGNNLKVGAGAGTHSDADDLLISKDAAISGISIQNADDGYGCINFGDASDNDIGRIAYQHNGNHMKFQVNTATRMEIEDDGNVKINDGNLIIGTAGHGIDFAATAGPAAGSGTQELLDDYEEGTWTPNVKFASTAAAGQANAGHYVKIGRMVYASYKFTLTDKGAGDGNFSLEGFPFAPKTGYSDIGGHFGYFHRFADANNDSGQVYQQFYSSIMYFAFRGLNANTTRLTDDNFRDDTACSGMIVYYTDA